MSDDQESLTGLREQVDVVDTQLVELLGRRFALTRMIGHLKAADNLPARDEARESHQHLRLAILAEEQGIDAAMVLHVYDAVMNRVVEEHEAIKHGEDF